MLNGLKINIGEIVKFTMFSNWTFKQNELYEVTDVSNTDKDGWFQIRVAGKKDWHCCMHFSLQENIQ